MHLPNYKDGSIVNLMASIKIALGEKKSKYAPLACFDVSSLKKKNILLLIIDGLGYEYLSKYGQKSFLKQNLKCKITSVLPSTTASAIPTFATGTAPNQHALTGWFMYLKELGAIITTLPFLYRSCICGPQQNNVAFKQVYDGKSFLNGSKIESAVVKHQDYVYSEFTKLNYKNATSYAFRTFDGFFKQSKLAIRKKSSRRKYIFAYLSTFDSICHKYGYDNKRAEEHFWRLDNQLEKLAAYAAKFNTAIIISADHGQVITREKERIILVKDHPEFAETLAMPLCGEPRFAYCYVKPHKKEQFEEYVKKNFSNACELHLSSELIKKNYFGLYDQNPKLVDRVGDYTLIMKENYIIKDPVLGEIDRAFIGNHGGTSKEEMFVPLIVINN